MAKETETAASAKEAEKKAEKASVKEEPATVAEESAKESKNASKPEVKKYEKKVDEGAKEETSTLEFTEVEDSMKYETAIDYLNVTLDEGAFAPERAHPDDAGLDLFSRENIVIPAGGARVFDTGVHIELPKFNLGANCEFYIRTAGFLRSKSGLYVKHGITSDGTIDVGYTGPIKVKLINHSKYDYQVNKGDKISQLVIVPVICPGVRIVHRLQPTVRGNNGFGSTGK